jgi:hypothetical protein
MPQSKGLAAEIRVKADHRTEETTFDRYLWVNPEW